MKKYSMLPHIILLSLMASCNSSSKDDNQEENNSGRVPLHGEIVFTDASDFNISYDQMNLELGLDIHEREGSDDMMRIGLAVDMVNLQMGIVALEPITPPENGIVINKTYTIGEENSDLSQLNGISFVLRKEERTEDYTSVDGTITFKYNAGITEGSFDANICRSEDWGKIVDFGQTDIETKHVSGTFRTDAVLFNCYTLENTAVDTATYGIDTDTSALGSNPTRTHMASLDHPFCKQYL